MVVKETYRLSGYIKYLSTSSGFVTPVFKDERESYFIQISKGSLQRCQWQMLRDRYFEDIIAVDSSDTISSMASFIYGFALNDEVFFANGKDMANHLSELLASGLTDNRRLVEGFVKNWTLLEPQPDNLTKEDIWITCLKIFSEESSTMPGIFLENFEVIHYVNSTLKLKAKDSSVKKVFENSFRDKLIEYFRKDIPDFTIVIDNIELVLTTPHVFYGGGDVIFTHGSFIIQTQIKPFQDFDNFIVGDFNKTAYRQTLSFIRDKDANILLIMGEAGVGKSYLANSIAKHYAVHDSRKKVGLYSVFSNDNKTEVTEQDLDEFETTASKNDVIVVDDVDHIWTEKNLSDRFIRLVNKWKHMHKSIVLSFRDTYQIDLIPELANESKQVILFTLDQNDKYKVLEFRNSQYNLKMSGSDILKATQNEELRNLTDIERFLTRTYLAEAIQRTDYNVFLSHLYEDGLKIKSFESLIHEYLKEKTNKTDIKLSKFTYLDAKLISHFLKDTFSRNYESFIQRPKDFIEDGLHFSMDTIRYHLFRSEAFKSTILEILQDLPTKDKGH